MSWIVAQFGSNGPHRRGIGLKREPMRRQGHGSFHALTKVTIGNGRQQVFVTRCKSLVVGQETSHLQLLRSPIRRTSVSSWLFATTLGWSKSTLLGVSLCNTSKNSSRLWSCTSQVQLQVDRLDTIIWKMFTSIIWRSSSGWSRPTST